MVTEVLYVRIPVTLKVELEGIAAEYGTSIAKVVARALGLYVVQQCGRELSEQLVEQLP